MSKSKPHTQPHAELDADAESPQRWTAKRKAALIIEILQGKTTAAEAARQHALTLAEIEQWKDDFITQGTEALRRHPRDLAQQFEAREEKDARRIVSMKSNELALRVLEVDRLLVFGACQRSALHEKPLCRTLPCPQVPGAWPVAQ